MKKALFSIFFLLIQLTLWAQTEKGRWNVGTSLGSFTYQSAEAGYSFSGSITPAVGAFAASNMLVGLGIPISLSSAKYTYPLSSNLSHSTTIGLSPFIRYYFGSSPLKPFVGLAFTYNHFNLHNENSSGESTNKGRSLQLTPSVGLAYFINRSISVNAQIGYNWSTTKSTSTDSSGGTTIDNPAYITKNATLTLGFNIFLGD